MHLRAAGTSVEVRVEDPALAAQLMPLVLPLAAAGDSVGEAIQLEILGTGPWEVRCGGSLRVRRCRHADETMVAALELLNLTVVAVGPHLTLHAAVLARGGSALVLPGPSGLGKTTLTAALLQRGWTYVSDEALVLPWDGGAAVPYPRTLALSRWSADALGVEGHPLGEEILVRAEDLGAASASPSSRVGVGAVILLERSPNEPHPEHPRVQDVGRGEVVRQLLKRCFNHYQNPARALVLLTDAVGGARTGLLRMGAPAPTAEAVDLWWNTPEGRVSR